MSSLQAAVLGYLAIESLLTVWMIGRERRPYTPGAAAICLLINGLVAWWVVLHP